MGSGYGKKGSKLLAVANLEMSRKLALERNQQSKSVSKVAIWIFGKEYPLKGVFFPNPNYIYLYICQFGNSLNPASILHLLSKFLVPKIWKLVRVTNELGGGGV